MLRDLVKEVYYLAKFKKAIRKTNLGDAAKYLQLQKEHSDAVEAHVKTTMADARDDMATQKQLMDNLIESL